MRAQRLKPSKVNPVKVWWQCCLPLTFAFLWIGMEGGNIVRFDGAEESGSRLEMRTPSSMNSVTEYRRRGQGMRDPLPDHGKAKKLLPKESLDSSQPKLGLIMPLTYRENALPRLATHQNPQSNHDRRPVQKETIYFALVRTKTPLVLHAAADPFLVPMSTSAPRPLPSRNLDSCVMSNHHTCATTASRITGSTTSARNNERGCLLACCC